MVLIHGHTSGKQIEIYICIRDDLPTSVHNPKYYHTCPYTYSLYHYVMPLIGPLWISHVDVIKSKHFPRYWPYVRGIHR